MGGLPNELVPIPTYSKQRVVNRRPQGSSSGLITIVVMTLLQISMMHIQVSVCVQMPVSCLGKGSQLNQLVFACHCQTYSQSRYGSAASLSSTRGASGSQSPASVEQLSKTNLYIRGLLPSTTDRDLYSYCQR